MPDVAEEDIGSARMSGDRTEHESRPGPVRDAPVAAADEGPTRKPPAAARDDRVTYLVDAHGTVTDCGREAVEERLREGTFFWLDIRHPGPEDFQLLADVFHFHPLAMEDTRQFGETPKLDEYDDYAFLVIFGVESNPERLVDMIEVHNFISEHYMVTVHDVPIEALDTVRVWFADRRDVQHPAAVLGYRIADALVDTFFPVLAELDDRLDSLEDDIFHDSDAAQLQDVLRMKRALVHMRKVVSPQRDLYARLINGIHGMPGTGSQSEAAKREAERYYRDVYDHLIRISDMIDTYRDLMTGTMDVYLSTVQNRMDGVMKKLTVIATIFLPLTWLTGFFGMNFGAMVKAVGDWQAFVILGVGLQVAAVVILVWLMRSRRWL